MLKSFSNFRPFSIATSKHSIRFLLNGKLVELKEGNFNPTDSLISYLRSENINLKGAKRGCDDGSCGACTVVLSSFDPVFGRVKHRAVSSCKITLGSLHNTSITTIERLNEKPQKGSKSQNSQLNPIQEALKKHNATQCGFCSPGFIMSTLAMILEHPEPTNDNLMYSLDGNLCRCTGYKSIIEALREFTVDVHPSDELISEKTKPRDKRTFNQEIIDSLKSISNFSQLYDKSENRPAVSNARDLPKEAVSIKFSDHTFYLPSTLDELLEIKKENPHATIVVGNTELAISSKPDNDYISPNLIDEMKFINIENTNNGRFLRIGASTTFDDIYEFGMKSFAGNRLIRAFCEKIKHFETNQTRNVASLTGSIISEINDFTDFLPGVGAQMKVVDAATKEERYLLFDDFFSNGKSNALKDTDIITEFILPYETLPVSEKTGISDYVFTYKISNRKGSNKSILSATIRADIGSDDIVKNVKIAFANLSSNKPIGLAKVAQEYLIGKPFTKANIRKAFELVSDEFPLTSDSDELDSYRREAAGAFLTKFFHQTQKQRGKIGEYDESIISSEDDATTFSIQPNAPSNSFKLSQNHAPEFRVSCQCGHHETTVPATNHSSDLVGKSVISKMAALHVQGKAEYADDIPLQSRTKHAALVTSTVAHGIIENIDTSAVANKNFSIFTADDIEGSNRVGDNNEELLVSKEVTYYGQPIAIVVADTEREAWEIAQQVKVQYQKLPAIMSIEDSIEKGKVFPIPSLKKGADVDTIFDECSRDEENGYHVIEGTIKIGGRYHFYMEPSASLTNISSDGLISIHPTTSHVSDVMQEAAKHLGIDANLIDVKTKRIGGAFHGKALRSAIVSSATALASQKLECPVKMVIPRSVDTQIMCEDHNCLNRFKVAFNVKTAKVLAIRMNLFLDSGYSYESTKGLLVKTVLHADSVYNIPNLEINASLCQTNKISASYLTSSGAQIGPTLMEGVMERVKHFIQDERSVEKGIEESRPAPKENDADSMTAYYKTRFNKEKRTTIDYQPTYSHSRAEYYKSPFYGVNLNEETKEEKQPEKVEQPVEPVKTKEEPPKPTSVDETEINQSMLAYYKTRHNRQTQVNTNFYKPEYSHSKARYFDIPNNQIPKPEKPKPKPINHHIETSGADLKSTNFYSLNDKTPYGITLDDITIDQCWDQLKEEARYEDLKRCVHAFNLVYKNKKRGLAITPIKFGVGVYNAKRRRGSCIVHLLKDGTVLISHNGIESGQGLNPKICAIASKILEVPYDSIHVSGADTVANTQSAIAGAGYLNDLVGFAVVDACQKLKKRIERFQYADSEHNEKRPFVEVVNLAFDAKEDLSAHGFYISEQQGFNLDTMTGEPYQYYEYAASVALVEIDVLTGEYKVLESHIVFDAGKSLNPAVDIGQIEGGFMRGLGWMTTEEIKYDKDGKPLNTTMTNYKIPSISNVPLKFSVHLLPNSVNKKGVMSSKGVGEPPEILANCVGFAIIDAIEDARKEKKMPRLTSYEFPLTPSRVKYYLSH